jgi:hypothetical protein
MICPKTSIATGTLFVFAATESATEASQTKEKEKSVMSI